MPELPEVESVCRVMRRSLVGKRIVSVEAKKDPLVFSGHTPRALAKALVGRTVEAVGRRGKFWWLTLDGEGPMLFGHLGMSGWIHGAGKLRSHGDADPARFLKLKITADDGATVAFTDARRFGRIWLGSSPDEDRQVARLGRDAHDDLPTVPELLEKLGRRKVAIKAVLLDQGVLAGIGNWVADEVLYQSGIAPKRAAASLDRAEVTRLRRAIASVLAHAVKVNADAERFPKTWLFEHRWGGGRGAARIGAHAIVRETVGGRTTAWVPTKQR